MVKNVTGRTGLHQLAEIPEAYKNKQELIHEKSMSLTPNILKLNDIELQRELERLSTEGPKPYRLWTEKEDSILAALYHKASNKKISIALGRPRDAIQKRAMRLGLTGND